MSSYRSNLTLSLGIFQTRVNLQSINDRPPSPFHRVCPDHHTRIKQRNICPEGEHEVTEFRLSADTPEGLRVLQPSQRPGFTADDALDFTVVTVKDIETRTTPGNGFYYCIPSTTVGATAQIWEILRRLADTGYGLVTKAALRQGEQKLWRLMAYRQYPALQELTYPDAVRAIPEMVDVKITASDFKQVKAYADRLVTPWEKFDSGDPNKAQLDRWIETGEIVAPPPDITKTPNLTIVEDLKTLLERAKTA